MDDDQDVLTAARLLLKQVANEVRTVRDPELLPAILMERSYDVIFLDMNFTSDISSGQEGFHWLGQILKLEPAAIVILMTAYGDIDMAVRAVKAGAIDFVMKPWQNEKLVASLNAGITLHQSRSETDQLKARQQQLSADLDEPYITMIGDSDKMLSIYRTIDKVADTDANVLVIGENGTGKELVARALHRQSSRAEEIFLSVDVGAISESLFESEFFGYQKGAFTDAKQGRVGRFEAASGGTLFLDEIGNLPLAMQAKLLTALESREITRLGDNEPRTIDIRLVCATNMDIGAMIAEGTFRQDLYYRVNTIEIPLPPLRERTDDIPLLIDHFMTRFGQKYRRDNLALTDDALAHLQDHSWPGNVRELKHTVERAVIMSEGNAVRLGDLAMPTSAHQSLPTIDAASDLASLEKSAIAQALGDHQGNVSKTAKALGISRTALYRRMEKYGL